MFTVLTTLSDLNVVTCRYPAQASLEVDRGVDFGSVVANCKVLSKTVKIVNHGSKPGEFRIKYTGDKPISILPTTGIVSAKSVQSIKVSSC